MNTIKLLLDEKRLSRGRLRFSTDIELQYRNSLRRHIRYQRTLLFFAIAIAFAIFPLQGASVFNSSESLRGAAETVGWFVSPLALAASWVSWKFTTPRAIAQGFQSSAVVVAFTGGLALRHLALTSNLQYPSSMLGLMILAVAIFGSFGAARLILSMLIFYGLAIVQEYVYLNPQNAAELSAQTHFYFVLISVLAAYSNEKLRRQSWIQSKVSHLLAHTDVLTGIANRSAFNLSYSLAFKQANRERKTLAVMVMDIDNFKPLNDSFGHLAGDDALQRIGAVLPTVSGLRPLDICARLGGDEFVVVWYDVEAAALPNLVEGLLDAVRRIKLSIPGRQEPYSITISAGLTWLVPGAESNAEHVIAMADALMYQAKAEGRDRAVIAPF